MSVSYCLLGCSGHNAVTGLNLTACNNVILVDLWWNPALEVRRLLSWASAWAKPFHQDQAFGRAHRIGQKKPVNIWKLTTEGTVEEKILAVCVSRFSPARTRHLSYDIPDSSKSLSASWRTPPYLERLGARLGHWVWTNSWICSSRTTITTRMRMMIEHLLRISVMCFVVLSVSTLYSTVCLMRITGPGADALTSGGMPRALLLMQNKRRV